MQEHRELAREAVRKSLVLLKNGKKGDKPLLPLPKKASKILVAGSHANDLGSQCGGWTITWQGLEGNNLTSGMLLFVFLYIIVDSCSICEFLYRRISYLDYSEPFSLVSPVNIISNGT